MVVNDRMGATPHRFGLSASRIAMVVREKSAGFTAFVIPRFHSHLSR